MKRTVPEPLPPGDSNEGNRAMYQKLKEGKSAPPKDINGWIALQDALPDENETVWLYHNVSRFLALGCRIYPQDEENGWLWAVSNGTIYSENRKIVAECEADDNYEFTHFCPLPILPV